MKAVCYSADAPWWGSFQDAANAAVDQHCNSGGVSGYFAQGQTKYFCIQHSALQKSEFWVQWKGKGGLTLDDNDCKLRLKNEINGCKWGGESTIADWYFRSDPNIGTC
ncbi:secreted protein [Paraphaeosphaeria sporulosa]